jgi:hypothetical protein
MNDIIGRPIREGDYVAYYTNVYKVLSVEGKTTTRGYGYIKIILANPSKTTKPVKKYSQEMCLIPAEEYTFWKLKDL